jgi:hypothetical protein
MSPSRREFLRNGALATAGIALAPHIAHPSVPPLIGADAAARPLLCDAADIARMRKTIQLPRFATYWQSLRDTDPAPDLAFLRDELQLNNHSAHMLRARLILDRTSFVYALTGDKKQLDLALRAIEKLLAYRRWDYFLEGGEHTIGLQRAPEATIALISAIEYLGDGMPPDLCAEIERQVAEKGAPACFRTLYGMKYPERVHGWGFDPEDSYTYRFDLRRWPLILNSTNLKIIPVAGLMMAGCLLHGRHPQAENWIALALQSAEAFSTMYGPDGSYDEGAGYWGYTSMHLTLALEVLHRRLGRDHRKLINFPGTSRYALAMSMPTVGQPRGCVNFGDAWTMGDISVAPWTARTQGDRVSQFVANTVGEVASPLSILWYDPRVKPEAPPASLQNVRLANDLVIGRTGWGERHGVVALRSGWPSNHEHADRNSVIFAAHGERLFHDPYKAAYSYTDPHWNLRLTQSHTAVLIDGKGHQYHDGHEGTNASWAEAHIEAFEERNGDLIVTSDATEAYRLVLPRVTLVRRSVFFLKPDILILLDRIRMDGDPLPVQVRFQVDNFDGKGSASVVQSAFRIVRPHATLQATLHGPVAPSLHTGILPVPADHGIHPYVEVVLPAGKEHVLLTVCTAAAEGDGHGTMSVDLNGSVFTVKGRHNERTIAARIDTNNDIPVISL